MTFRVNSKFHFLSCIQSIPLSSTLESSPYVKGDSARDEEFFSTVPPYILFVNCFHHITIVRPLRTVQSRFVKHELEPS